MDSNIGSNHFTPLQKPHPRGRKLNRKTGILLGRPFFDNFDFIQFCHKNRYREDKCFFNYKVAKGKAIDILPIQMKENLINISKISVVPNPK